MAIRTDQFTNSLTVVDTVNANASLSLIPQGTGSISMPGTGQNFLLQSNTFSNVAWIKNTVTLTGSQSDPFGGSTATKVDATGGDSYLYQAYTVATGLTYTFSVYLRADTNTSLLIRLYDTLSALSTDVSVTATTSWQRFSVTRTVGSGTTEWAIIGSLGTLTTGETIYAYGTQVEIGSVANTYIPTTTSAIYGTPSLSFSGVSGLGLQSDGSLYASSAGTGNVRFYTNNIGQEQARVSHTASAVNYHQLTGSATGSGPIHSVAGSDTNIDLNLTTKGTGVVNLNTGAGTQVRIIDSGGTAVNRIHLQGQATGFLPVIASRGSDTNLGMSYSTQGTGGHDFYTAGASFTQQVKISHTASAVNYLQVQGGTTGSVNGATISSQGSDADVNLRVVPKGAGYLYVRQDSTASTGILLQNRSSTGSPEMGIRFITGGFDLSDSRYAEISSTGGGSNTLIFKTGNGTSPQEFLRIAANGDMTLGGSNTAPNFKIVRNGSAINFLQVTGAATGSGVTLSAQGSDTNIPLVLQPKGTGALQAQQTDSTATGGNARGVNAVDWQMVRGVANQVASAPNTVISGGQNNTSSSLLAAVSGGFNNNCSGNSAFIGGGQYNVSSQIMSVVVGGGVNTAAGIYNFIGGGFTNSGTANGAVTSQSATMNGTTAVTLSASNANIKVGQYVFGTSIGADTFVAAISGTSLTLSKAASGSSTNSISFFTPHGVVVGGGNNQATGSYSFIGGGGDAGTAANRNAASGDWSVVGGGRKNTASGIGSTVAGGGTDGTNIFSNTASGTLSTVGGGWNNTANGQLATVAGGQSNGASAFGSAILGGSDNAATGSYSTILGGVYGTTRGISGNIAFSASYLPITTAFGVNQSSFLHLAVQTTDATSTVLRSTGAAAGTTNQVILPNNAAYFFTGEVVAGVTGGGNTKGWTIEGVIKRGANAASTALVGTPMVTSAYADVGAATWAIAVTADTTNGGLAVTFTGQLATTIRVVCQVRTTEMTF